MNESLFARLRRWFSDLAYAFEASESKLVLHRLAAIEERLQRLEAKTGSADGNA